MENSIVQLLRHLGVRKHPKTGYDYALHFGNAYSKLFTKYGINTPKRVAAFFGNVLHECCYLKVTSENLNYSAKTLARVWPNRFASGGRPNSLALSIAGNPVKIANICYGGRMGNGHAETGDGYKYRGRGPIQTTGKNNYRELQEKTGIPCLTNPDILLDPRYGAEASCYFWVSNNINKYADIGDFDGCADVVNKGHKTGKVGDAIGYKDRHQIYRKALAWFMKNKLVLEEYDLIPLDKEQINNMKEANLESEFDSATDLSKEFDSSDELVFGDGDDGLDDNGYPPSDVFEM